MLGAMLSHIATANAATIKGIVKGSGIKYVYFELHSGRTSSVDSVAVQNGSFEKTITATPGSTIWVSLDEPLALVDNAGPAARDKMQKFYPTVGNPQSDAQRRLRPILSDIITKPKEEKFLLALNDTDTVLLTIPQEGIRDITVSQNDNVEKYLEFTKAVAPLQQQVEAVEYAYKTYEGAVTTAVIAGFDDKLTSLEKQQRIAALKFTKENLHSPYLDQVILNYLVQDIPALRELIEFAKDTPISYKLKKYDRYAKTALGTSAPNFTASTANGTSITLSDVKGKVILVEFWASWCTPCRAENPYLAYTHDRYKDKGFTLVSFSLDNKKEDWIKAMEKDGIVWTSVSDLKGIKSEVSAEYGVRGVPSNFLIYDGKIVAMNVRKHMLNEKLQELLK